MEKIEMKKQIEQEKMKKEDGKETKKSKIRDDNA